MTIGQVARSAGVTPSAIRFYESSGLLPKPGRKSGIRDYDPRIVDQIRALRFLRSSGVPIRDLASIFSSASLGSEQSKAVVKARIAELDRVIKDARAMKARLHGLLACECRNDKQKCVIYQ